MMTALFVSQRYGGVTGPDGGRGRASWWVPAIAGILLTAATAASAQVSDWPAELPPKPLAPHEVSFPPYEVRTLSNGMQVMTVLHHEQPAVTMRLLVRAGAAQDPVGKDGVAYLAAQLLDQGTASKSASQIADEIDFIGGAMGTASLPDLTAANVIVMKDSFEAGLRMLNDVVRNPVFAAEEIERQKKQILSTLQVSGDDPEYVANAVFDRLVYGSHPYGLPATGTPETIAGISREDLLAFHRRYYLPNNMILAIVGDVTSEEAFSAAERVFGAWPRGDLKFDKPAAPPAAAPRVVIIDKPDAVQTEIRMGLLALPRKDPDYLTWDLAIKILGGEGANRLHRVLRAERGLTYGASADTEAMKQAGDFVAETDTRTDNTAQVLSLMLDEMVKLRLVPVSLRELGDAQAYLSGSFPLTIETPNEIAVQVLNAMFYELPMQEISNFRERVTAIRPDDILRVAQQYLRTDRLSVVLVGNARGFIPQIERLGLTRYEVIPIGELDLMQPSLHRGRVRAANDTVRRPAAAVSRGGQMGMVSVGRVLPDPADQTSVPQQPRRPSAAPPAPTPAPGTSAPVRPAPSEAVAQPRPSGAAAELLRRVVAARGGLEALKSVRSVVADTDTTFMDERGQAAQAAKTKTYVLYPDKFRVDAFIQNDQIVQIYNAGRAWEKSPGGIVELPPEVRAEAASAVKRDMIPLLIGAAEGRLTTRVLEDERSSDGRTLHVLQVSGPDVEPVQLYIDEQMLVAKQSFWTNVSAPPARSGGRGGDSASARSVRSEEVFSDYRTVNGVKVPFQAAVVRDGRTLVKRVLTRVVLNDPSVDARLFEQPR